MSEKNITQKDSGEKHPSIHSKENPFMKDIHSLKYFSEGDASEHLNHTLKKTLTCDICFKVFVKRSTLNRHIRTHTDKKPYICEICSQKFSRKDYLSSHILTHTGENHLCVMHALKYFQDKPS